MDVNEPFCGIFPCVAFLSFFLFVCFWVVAWLH